MMIEIVSAAGVAMLFLAAFWVGSRWRRDQAQLMREESHSHYRHATVLLRIIVRKPSYNSKLQDSSER